jgi:membrane associated rhomboid family serine protease
MRSPPPLNNRALTAYPVTFGLGLLAVIASLAWWSGEDIGGLFQDVRAFHGEPWRLLTCALPHVALWHLAFNLYWLWVFGTLVEESFGHLRTAALVLLLAGGSAAVAGVFGEDGVGLSGVGYGLFAFLWVLGRRDERFRGAVDAQTAGLFVAWFILCILLTRSGALHVGNFAHGAGATFGALAGLAVAVPRWRPALATLTGAALALALLAGTLWRPDLNLYGGPGYDLALMGDRELRAGDAARAADLLRQAVAADGGQASWWYNLGVAYCRLGRWPEAEDALDRALRLNRGDADFRKALAECEAYLAYQSQVRGDHAAAAKRYRKALELDGGSARTWYNLGTACERLGRLAEARDAYRRAAELDPGAAPHREALESLEPAAGAPGPAGS